MLYFPVGQVEIVFLVVVETLPTQLALDSVTCLITWSIHAFFGTHRYALLVTVHVLFFGVALCEREEEWKVTHVENCFP